MVSSYSFSAVKYIVLIVSQTSGCEKVKTPGLIAMTPYAMSACSQTLC